MLQVQLVIDLASAKNFLIRNDVSDDDNEVWDT